MKKKHVIALLALTVAFSSVMTACSLPGLGDKGGEVVVEVTPTPEPTKAPDPTPTPVPADVQSNTYTSADKSVSVSLPDATWANKADESGMLSFESPKQGKLLIVHGEGDEDMSVAVIPSTPDTAVSLEKASDLEQNTDFVIHSYTSKNVEGVDIYYYVTEYLTAKKGYAYVVNKYFVNENEYYKITGSVKEKNKKALKKVKDAVQSFTIKGDSSLKAAASGKSSDKKDKAAASEESKGSVDISTENYGDEALSDNEQTRTIYRNSDGSALVIYNDGNGNWADENGNTYDFFSDEDVYDQDGVDYYYHGEAADVYFMPYE